MVVTGKCISTAKFIYNIPLFPQEVLSSILLTALKELSRRLRMLKSLASIFQIRRL